ncbi:MAG: hypothetical protein HZA93_16690 [Verrucomicrobia bacterium]|nr:hypothetical protein [Verrucomicrobiota bacterium]
MKLAPAVLAVSLAANIGLVALLWRRSETTPPAPHAPAEPRAPDAALAAEAKKRDTLLAALSGGDPAAMTAAGVPAEVANHLAAARAFGRLAALERDGRGKVAVPAEYWRRGPGKPRPPPTREQRAERSAAEREFEVAMKKAFGEDPFGGGGDGRFGFLAAATRERLERIERDYDEMRREVSLDAEGFQLAADREKLKLLETEKQRDLMAAMTPAERDQFELRSSPAANAIIGRYGDILASEDEFRRLFTIQKAFDEKYSSPDYQLRPRTPEENRQRAEAERQLNDDLRAAIGDDRWAATSRANDREFQSLTTLAARLNLPAATADQVYALRDNYAAQSAAINQNATLSATERRSQLTALAGRAKADLGARLGTDGGDAYARSASWVNLLQNGQAFTTDARQLPAGSPRPGGGTAFQLPAPRPPPPARP